MGKIHPAKWWFAWYPVRTADTERWIWLKKVYREWWYKKNYFENPKQSKEEL